MGPSTTKESKTTAIEVRPDSVGLMPCDTLVKSGQGDAGPQTPRRQIRSRTTVVEPKRDFFARRSGSGPAADAKRSPPRGHSLDAFIRSCALVHRARRGLLWLSKAIPINRAHAAAEKSTRSVTMADPFRC
jgi:hypothetical protein